MELYIRSQDKYTLLKYNNKITIIDGTNLKEILDKSLFSAFADMEQIKELKDGWCVNVDDLILGTYATKERALQVLDEIQSILEQILDPNLTILKIFVYEMPSE